ncbi:hypothetical protein AS026_37805 [Rhizobium altiplani]|uniref:Uncharacterized protein n=1 Tax=Rhizobium altiplani TaxID=1864509 RepID=A0A109JUD7_9HYPH|nr:hypothetical protein AS026_37805 [Rhizobium altiplani]
MQIVGNQAHAAAIPEDQLDPVRSFGAEHINRAREWVSTHLRLHERRQSLSTFALMWCTT